MKNLSHLGSNRVRRAAAFCVALLYSWMATTGVVCHTDDLQSGGSFSAKVIVSHSLSAAKMATGCAACQWLAGLQAVPQATIFLTTPPVFLSWSFSAPNCTSVSRPSAQNNPRAPPRA